MRESNLLRVRHGASTRAFEDGCGLSSLGRVRPEERRSVPAARDLRRRLHAFCDKHDLDRRCRAAFLAGGGCLACSPFPDGVVEAGRVVVVDWLANYGVQASAVVAPHQPIRLDFFGAALHVLHDADQDIGGNLHQGIDLANGAVVKGNKFELDAERFSAVDSNYSSVSYTLAEVRALLQSYVDRGIMKGPFTLQESHAQWD